MIENSAPRPQLYQQVSSSGGGALCWLLITVTSAVQLSSFQLIEASLPAPPPTHTPTTMFTIYCLFSHFECSLCRTTAPPVVVCPRSSLLQPDYFKRSLHSVFGDIISHPMLLKPSLLLPSFSFLCFSSKRIVSCSSVSL